VVLRTLSQARAWRPAVVARLAQTLGLRIDMIRPAKPDEDADAVATILIESRRAFLPFAPSAHPERDVRNWVKNRLLPTGRVVVWEEGGTVVAVLATSEESTCSWIDQLYVLPGWDGKGIGTKLLQHAHDALSQPIHLYAFQENVGARRFYERNGYKAVQFTDGQGNEERCPDVLYVYA
jgi:GNAT superfamily N-acetyltransferase